MKDVGVVVMAAGKGSRMKSDRAKVLHPVAGKSMVNHVVGAARAVTEEQIYVVVGHQAGRVRTEVSRYHKVRFALQKDLVGTGDAVKTAMPLIDRAVRHVLVLSGDVPLIQKETILGLVRAHQKAEAALTVLAVRVDDPTGYGRVIRSDAGGLEAIREEVDASEEEKKITLINSGIYCFERGFLETGLGLIDNNNKQGEYYLTDLVETAVEKKSKTLVQKASDPWQVMGVNTLDQLASAEALFRGTPDELP